MTKYGPLPAWATFAEYQEKGQIPRIVVDVDAMYRAWLAEFAENPPRSVKTETGDAVSYPEFPGGAYTIRLSGVAPKQETAGPMTAEQAICDPAKPTQYWLECAYQCMKLELQIAMRTHGFEIRIKDATKTYALAKHPPGRGYAVATWGKEAKEHFRRLRGALP